MPKLIKRQTPRHALLMILETTKLRNAHLWRKWKSPRVTLSDFMSLQVFKIAKDSENTDFAKKESKLRKFKTGKNRDPLNFTQKRILRVQKSEVSGQRMLACQSAIR